jgi:tripartite-type tricarboxylate transporter receptor subunit TctC
MPAVCSRSRRAFVVGAAAALTAPRRALGQGYPSKAVQIVVPFAPGGATDIVARLVAAKLNERLGQPVVIENRPGAGGNIGAAVAAKAAPDGYTMFMGTISTHAINPSLYAKLGYDPVRDFAPVSLLTSVPLVLVVHPGLGARSIKDVIALAKAKPGELTYASPGAGTALHLAGELFKTLAGVDIVHVPYKGSAPALTDVMAGRVSLMFDTSLSALPHVKGGKLHALAVTTARRSPMLPELPTVTEAGVPGFEVSAWNGVLVPAGTPRDVVGRLATEIAAIMKLPDVRDRLGAQGAEAIGSTPDEFARYIAAETAKWAVVVRASGARVD